MTHIIKEQLDKRVHNLSPQLILIAVGLLLLLFLMLNLAILVSGGIRLGGDSPRYLEGAENLLRGHPLQGKQIFYSGYAGLIAFCRFVGIGLPGVIAIQLLLAALASVALYDLGRRLYGHWAGLIAAGLFIANPDIARWHAFILTDSLYISLVILSVWCVHTAAQRKRFWYAIVALVLVAAALVRPNGLSLMAVSVLYLTGCAISRKSLRWLTISALVLIFISGAIIASRSYRASTNWPSRQIVRNETVAGQAFATLGKLFTRVATELIHIRPFYSLRHNIILLATLPLLYLLALIGLKRQRDTSLAHLLILVITVHLGVVAFTYADWDGRYLLYILPLIFLFSSCAIAYWIDSYLLRRPFGVNMKGVAGCSAGE